MKSRDYTRISTKIKITDSQVVSSELKHGDRWTKMYDLIMMILFRT
jgi:hypothetical protein